MSATTGRSLPSMVSSGMLPASSSECSRPAERFLRGCGATSAGGQTSSAARQDTSTARRPRWPATVM